MKKCPQCGRSYSDMVQVCPACNITLGGSTSGPKPAAKERPREERKETAVREERVAQKKPKQKSAKNTSPAPAPKGPSPLVGVVGLIVLVCIVFYMNSQTKEKQAAIERSNPTVQATVEKHLSAESTSASESTVASVTINGSVQYAEMMYEPDVHGDSIATLFQGESGYYRVIIQSDITPGEYCVDRNNLIMISDEKDDNLSTFQDYTAGTSLQIDMRANFKTGQTLISGTFILNPDENCIGVSEFSFSVVVPTSELIQNENNVEDEPSTESAAESQRTEAVTEQPAVEDDRLAEEPTSTEPETQMPVSVSPDTAVLRFDGEEYTFYLSKTSTEAIGNTCYGVYLCKGANGTDRYRLHISFYKDIQPGTFRPFWDGVYVIMTDLKSNTKYSLDIEQPFIITEADSGQLTYAGRCYGEMETKNRSGELSYAFTLESCEFRFTVYKVIS